MAPDRTAPIASAPDDFLRQIYPARYRRIWAYPPTLPSELATSDDVLALLTVKSPFAAYLRKATAADISQVPKAGGAADYIIDMRVFEQYPAKTGLMRPGGMAFFQVQGSHLRTLGILYRGEFHAVGSSGFRRALRTLLCALNTHLTTLLHNVYIHLACVTPMTVATTNELPADHPVRRLLHPGCQTALIGNFEVAHFQIAGPEAFAIKLFSHDYPTLSKIINYHLDRFHIADLDPDYDLARRGVAVTPFAYPQRDNMLQLWALTREFVSRYIDLYYPDDQAVATDEALERWRASLDRLMPAGLADEDGWIEKVRLNRTTLKRIAAAYLHASSTTHDQVNNVVWNYSTLNYLIPTVVPESGAEQDQRLSFDFVTTLIGTWKPFNMLLDGISQLALDERARALMNSYINDLRSAEKVMYQAEGPNRPDLTYPRNLNPSVTN
jgi:hypothetical protein